MAAVGTCTMSAAGVKGGTVCIFACTTDGSTGAVSGIPLTVPAGTIRTVKVIPGTSTTQPTNLFDLTILDSDGLDILSGAGADRPNDSVTLYQFDPPFFHDGGTLAVTIANGGNSKTATVKIAVF